MHQHLLNKSYMLEQQLKGEKMKQIALEKEIVYLEALTKAMKSGFQEAIGSWKRHAKGIKKQKLHREQLTKETVVYKIPFPSSKGITDDESAMTYLKNNMMHLYPGYTLEKVIGYYQEETNEYEWVAQLLRNITCEEQTLYNMEEL